MILGWIYWGYLKGRLLSLKLLSSYICIETARCIWICLSPSLLYLSAFLAIKGLDCGSDIPLTTGIIFVLDPGVQSLALVLTTSLLDSTFLDFSLYHSFTSGHLNLSFFIWLLVSVLYRQEIFLSGHLASSVTSNWRQLPLIFWARQLFEGVVVAHWRNPDIQLETKQSKAGVQLLSAQLS